MFALFSVSRFYICALAAFSFLSIPANAAPPGVTESMKATDQPAIANRFNALPLSFEKNRGQTDPHVKFLSRGAGFSALFRQGEADLLLTRRDRFGASAGDIQSRRGTEKQELLRMRLVAAREDAPVSGEELLPGTVNYFVGNDPSKWRTSVPTFERIRYSGVYPGTDLVYYGSGGRLEFDFQLAAGADPSTIRIQLEGARRLKLDGDGNLIVIGSGGQIGFHKPAIYQLTSAGVRRPVAGAFAISRGNTIGFTLGKFDRTRPLVIDPILNYSTFIGTPSIAYDVAVDSAGEAFVAGIAGPGFPATAGAFQTAPVTVAINSGEEVPFVAKFNSSGSALLYCTYLSGSVIYDWAFAIAVDSKGNAFVGGRTQSPDFPITQGALQTVNRSTLDNGTAFVSELNSTGSALIYSTFLGGTAGSAVTGIRVDDSDNAYVTGRTFDTDFPTTAGAFQTKVSKSAVNTPSVFISKLNPTGTALIYSTYVTGTLDDYPGKIAVDGAGEVYVAGGTRSTDFPTTPGAFQLTNNAQQLNNETGFVAKLNADGTALVWSTYLGGSFVDEATAVAADASGVYVTGNTLSSDFPTTPGAFQTTLKATNVFITKIKPDGSGLVYSTYLGASINGGGGQAEDSGTAIAVDGQGNAVVAGRTDALDFPLTPGAFETENQSELYSGNHGSFLTKINSTGSALLYSTFLSGSGDESGEDCECAYGMALDPAGNAYVVGHTDSIDFPITLGAYPNPSANFVYGMFLTEFNAAEMTILPVPNVTVTSNGTPQEYGQPLTFTATVTGSGSTSPTGTVGFSLWGVQISDCLGDCVGLGPWIVVPLNPSGVATYTPPLGSVYAMPSIPVIAHYLGDANYAPADGSMTEVVTPIPITMTETASVSTITWGQPITFTTKVLDDKGNAVPGYVYFMIDQTAYGQTNLDGTGSATWTLPDSGEYPLNVGQNTVRAVYSQFGGMGNRYGDGSASATVTVNATGPAPPPSFSPPAGTYTATQTVYINDSNSAATIYYTTDGTVPNVGTSSSFPEGFVVFVSNSQTINAIATAPGLSASPVVSAYYTINALQPDFSIGLATGAMTVSAGQSGTTQVSIAGVNGFSQSVSLSCSGLPSGVTCRFSPNAASPGASSTLTISASTVAANGATRVGFPLGSLLAIAGGVGLLSLRRRSLRLLMLLPLTVALAWSGYGSGGSNSGPPPTPTPTTSTVTITGTSGSLSHSASLTLTLN